MPDPVYRVCPECTEYTTLSPTELGDLLSRDYGLKPVRTLTFTEIDNKPGSPNGWFRHVEKSILETGRVNDPLGVVRTPTGMELINGNHRSWVAHEHGIACRAYIFTPICGKCTEALFLDSINAWTRAIGWMYHQQGFHNTPTSWT